MLVTNTSITMKIFFTSIGASALLIIGFSAWISSTQSPANSGSPDIVSTRGLHWHPQLTIYVKGEKVEIPHNVGLGAVHQPMHTHEDLPIIHLEFQSMVRKEDLTLGQFFKIWGKDMQSFGANMKMMVNGTENAEFENYQMKDGDKIELRYE